MVRVHHNNRNAKKKKAPKVAMMTGYHPDYMFCGSCTDCHETTTASAPIVPSAIDDDGDGTSVTLASLTARKRTAICIGKANDLSASGGDGGDVMEDHDKRVWETLLSPLYGVEKVEVVAENISSSATATVHVEYDSSLIQPQIDLIPVLEQAGYSNCRAVETWELADEDASSKHGTTSNSSAEEEESKQRPVVKSVLFVQGICCASEVPSIRRIVRPLPGVQSLSLNITTKRVYVRHFVDDDNDDSDCPSSATSILQHVMNELSRQGFPASVVTDGTLHWRRTQLYANKNNITTEEGDMENEADSRKTQLPPRSKFVESTLLLTATTSNDRNDDDSMVSSEFSLKDAKSLDTFLSQATRRAHVRAISVSFLASNCSMLICKVEHQPTLLGIKTLVSLCQTWSNSTDKTVLNGSAKVVVNKATSDDKNRCGGIRISIASDGEAEGLYLPILDGADGIDSVGSTKPKGAIEFDANALEWHVWISGAFWVLALLGDLLDLPWLEYSGLVSVVFGLPSVALKAWRTLRFRGLRSLDANCMMVTAAVGSLLLGEWDEAASVAFLFCVSEFLEHRATFRARKALADIIELRPEHAHVVKSSNEILIIPADQVPIGSLLRVRTGDKIAADGVVVSGTSSVDESSLTGESVPVRKTPDDLVAGGSINVGASPLTVRTTCSVQDSAVSRLVRLVEDASANVSQTEKLIDAFARAYTPVVVATAVLMCTLPWLWGAEAGRHWMLNGLIIIVVACPCALTISTPVTYAAALAATAQRGIVVKGGSSLEALGNVGKVVFDKTGTLTQGKFNVVHLEYFGTGSRQEMLALLALIESPSSHPLSSTLVKAAQREGVAIPTPATMRMEDHSILKGEGVSAVINGTKVYVGNRRLFERLGMFQNLPVARSRTAEEWSQSGGTVGFLGIEGEGIIGAFSLMDVVREDAKDAVLALRACGVQVMMLTGDSREAALSVAKQVGMPAEDVHAQLTPEDKLHFVGSIKTPAPRSCVQFMNHQKQVVFIGDGINDGPALAVADVGIAMGEGASLALEMSDVTLMDSSLSKLIYVMNMGIRVVTTIKENIALSLLCKIVVVGLTFYGKMTLMYAIASDVGVMLLVTLNGMKLLPSRHTDKSTRKPINAAPDRQELLPLAGRPLCASEVV